MALGARPGAGVRRVRRPRAGARLPALARRAGARHLPARRGGVRALERRAGRAVRRRQRVVPALRRARLRRRAVPRAGGLGGRARGREAARAARCCSSRRACCAPRRGCWRPLVARSTAASSYALALAAAPVIWALTDLAVTGDPLHSLHATSELADDLGRERGLDAGAGLVRVVRRRHGRARRSRCSRRSASCSRCCTLGWQALRVPLALFAAGVITFVGTGLLGLSILPRYLTVPAVALCLFAGYALLGFTELQDARAPLWARGLGGRRGARRGRPDRPRAVADQRARGGALHPRHPRQPDRDARRSRGARGHALRHAHVPDLPARARTRAGTSRAPRSARARRCAAPRGVEVFALGQKALRRYGFAAGTSPRVNLPSPGYEPVARHGAAERRTGAADALGAEPPALDPERLQALPQRPVLRVGGLRERPLAQLEVRLHARAGARPQRRDPLLGPVGDRHRAVPRAHALEVGRDRAPPELGVLEDPVRQRGVVELRALERDDPDVGERDQPRRLLVRAAPEPDEVRRRAAGLVVRVVRRTRRRATRRSAAAPAPASAPRPRAAAPSRCGGRGARARPRRPCRPDRAPGTSRRRAGPAAARRLPRARARRARRRRRCSPRRAGSRPGAGPRAARAGAAWRRRRPRSGPSASTTARRPDGARSARARADTAAGGRSRSRAGRRAASAAAPGSPRARRRPTPAAAGTRRRRSAPARRRRRPGAVSRSSAWSRRMKLLERRAAAAARRSAAARARPARPARRCAEPRRARPPSVAAARVGHRDQTLASSAR